MKILLLGDFSSSMRFLKKGLEENGCKVDHFALQNGWRNNPVSNQLNSKKNLCSFRGLKHTKIV